MAYSPDDLRVSLGDRYELIGQIGSGGMAEVYLARDLKHERDVALKVFRPELADIIGTERFLREIRIAAKLHHPHILPLYDSGQTDGLLYYVMPHVAGESLRQRMEREGLLPLEDALQIARQVASALDYAHRNGIVHRDVKPANVLLAEDQALVADFGIALAVQAAGGDRITRTGQFIGTPEYMSPEQATGDPRIDARTDVYSLGCLLYEMLAGETPFRGATTQAVVARIITEQPPDLRTARAHVPDAVATAVHRALAKLPADRFGSAAEFAAAIAPSATPARATLQAGPAGAGRSARHRRTIAATVIAGAVMAAGVPSVWVLTRAGDDVPGIHAGTGRLSLLLETEGRVLEPALSPDGRMVAYAASDDSGTDLFVRLAGGGEAVRITHDAALENHPSFSPDGARLAYTRTDAARTPAIWVVPALGGQATQVVHGARMPAWSPAGDEIAYVRERPGGNEELVRTTLDGARTRTIFVNAAPYASIRHPAWSPDGRTLVFVRSLGGASGEIWTVPADGGTARPLLETEGAVASHHPRFTADGRGIVHSSNRGGATNLWVAFLDGGTPVQLTAGAGPDESPSVAADGSIVYVNSRWRSTLAVQPVDSAGARTIATHPFYMWNPTIAPDGRDIAFSRSESDGAWHIWIVPATGGAARQLTRGATPYVYPRFTPDGSAILYFSWLTGASRVWRVPRDGGQAEALTPADIDAAYADMSPDGRSLAFARTVEGAPQLHTLSLATGELRRLVPGAGTLPRWSPHGDWIAFTRDRGYEGGIFLVRADGSGERRLTDRGGWPVWWPDGRRIGYLQPDDDGTQTMRVVSVDSGESQILPVRFPVLNSPFDIAGDGRFFAVTGGVHLGDQIWLLEFPR